MNLWPALALILLPPATSAQFSMPSQLVGTWKIARVIPTKNVVCWSEAPTLVGSLLTYAPRAMRWRGGRVPLTGALTRTQTPDAFAQENSSSIGFRLTFADLGIRLPQVTEVDLQHEDADITGATTEVPGDTILMTGPRNIVVSACGTYFLATRVSKP